uniref:Uncharacterized protein n=1 Tax=Octopus bimaculoides TaxID=37653 RepID=A0A0L8H444_OCTBM
MYFKQNSASHGGLGTNLCIFVITYLYRIVFRSFSSKMCYGILSITFIFSGLFMTVSSTSNCS